MNATDGPSGLGEPGDSPPADVHTNDAQTDDALEQSWGILSWEELARHFARGVVVVASPASDLLEVAASMAADDAGAIRRLIEAGQLARASDDDARGWVASEPSFRCVVVAPWVLVQPLH